MISRQLLILSLLACYAGFACANDLTYGEWQAMREAQMAVPEVKPVQQSWISRVMTQPLVDTAQKYLREQQEFLTQEVEKAKPQLAIDKERFGHIKRVKRDSPEHKAWLEKHLEPVDYNGKKISYGAANPIYVTDDYLYHTEAGRDTSLEKAFRDDFEGRQYYRNQIGKLRDIQKERALGRKETEDLVKYWRNLDKAEHRLEEFYPYEYVRTREHQDQVRQQRLKQLEDRMKHPTDYYLNSRAWVQNVMHTAHETPYYKRVPKAKEWLEEETIGSYTQPGRSGEHMSNYRTFDERLRNLLYHMSDEIRENAAKKDRETGDIRGYLMEREWPEELNRLYNEKRARQGKKPSKYGTWYDLQQAKEAKNRRIERERREAEYKAWLEQLERLEKQKASHLSRVDKINSKK